MLTIKNIFLYKVAILYNYGDHEIQLRKNVPSFLYNKNSSTFPINYGTSCWQKESGMRVLKRFWPKAILTAL